MSSPPGPPPPAAKKPRKGKEVMVWNIKPKTVTHRVGKLPKDGREGTLKKATISHLLLERKTHGGTIKVIGGEIGSQEAVTVGEESGLLLETEVEKIEVASLLETYATQLEALKQEVGELKSTIAAQKEVNDSQATTLERLAIFAERGEGVILRTFIRAPIEALMKDTKQDVRTVNRNLDPLDGREYFGRVLHLGEWELIVDSPLTRFMRRSQEVANVLSRGVHSATPLEVAAALQDPRIRIPQPLTRRDLLNQYNALFGLMPAEVLKQDKEGSLDPKFRVDI